MIISYLVGIIIGLIFALPPGPVVIASVKIGINNGIKEGLYIAFGTGLVDFSLATISVFSSYLIINVIQGFIEDNSIIYKILQFVFITVISGYGIKMLLYKTKEKEREIKNLSRISRKGSFFLGIGISLTNILNPMFFSSLLMVGYFAQKYALNSNDIFEKIFFGLGFGSGTLIWLLGVNILIQFLKSKSSQKIIIIIHRIAGLSLVLSGIIASYNLILSMA